MTLPRPPFEELGLNVEDNEGNIRPATDIANQARAAAAEGNFEQAFWQMLSLVTAAGVYGLPDSAAELLDRLHSLVPADTLTPDRRAWLLNAQGLTAGAEGRTQEAIRFFTEMLEVGRSISDLHITSTALQNLGTYHFRLGKYDQAREYYKQSVQEKIETKDYRGLVQVMVNSVSLDEAQGKLDSAEQTLDTVDGLLKYAASPEPHLHATALGMQAIITAKRGDHATAERLFRRALRYARASGNLDTVVLCLRNIARALQDQGKTKQAIRWYARALEAAKNLEVVSTVAELQQSMAALLYSIGRKQEAVEHLRTAQQLASRTDDTLWWAKITSDLGAVTLADGNLQAARDMLSSLPDIFHQYGDIAGETRALRTLFNLEIVEKNVKQATAYLERALTLVPEEAQQDRAGLYRYAAHTMLDGHIPSEHASHLFEEGLDAMSQALRQQEQGVSLSSVAWYAVQAAARLRDAGDHESAIPFFERGLALYEESHEQQMAFHTRMDLANAYTRTRQFAKAKQQFDMCLETARRLNDRVMELRASMNLAEMLTRQDKFDEALALIDHALSLARALDDTQAEGELLSNKGSALVEMLALDDAEHAIKQARDIARGLGDDQDALSLLTRTTAALANVEFLRKHYRRAARLYLRAAEIKRAGDRGSERNVMESLGAALECYSALADEANTQKYAQEVVTLAQKTGDYDGLHKHIARSARFWLDRQQYEEAASLYAISILVAMADPFAELNEKRWYTEILKAAYVVVAFVEEAGLEKPSDFYERLVVEAERQHEGTGNMVRTAIDMALEMIHRPKRRSRRRLRGRLRSLMLRSRARNRRAQE